MSGASVASRVRSGDIRGIDALLREIDKAHEEWEASESEVPIHEHLGLTELEYSVYLTKPYSLGMLVHCDEELQKKLNFIDGYNLTVRSFR